MPPSLDISAFSNPITFQHLILNPLLLDSFGNAEMTNEILAPSWQE
jgi:hypothetical protein